MENAHCFALYELNGTVRTEGITAKCFYQSWFNYLVIWVIVS